MATTSPNNIWTPDSGDDYALTVDLAAMADTVQDAITNNKTTFEGLDSSRPANGTPGLVSGMTWYSTDTDTLWRYLGGTWRIWIQPSRPYTPTVSGLTLGNGTMTARASRLGTRVSFSIGVIAGTTTVATNNVTLGLPYVSETSVPFKQFGSGSFRLGASTAYPLMARWFSTGPSEITLNLLSSAAATLATGTNVSNLFPTSGSWATGTTFFVEGSYETTA